MLSLHRENDDDNQIIDMDIMIMMITIVLMTVRWRRIRRIVRVTSMMMRYLMKFKRKTGKV